MLRIVALNEEPDELEEEIHVTQEAQETIAESEYVRAIKLKCSGKSEMALSLLNQLLETKVLNEAASVDNNKLWAIRYNCHKNIAIIYEEKEDFEKALENYIFAMHIDDTDVYTMHRFGQLALKTGSLELAEFAFTNCLRQNPSHWNAADGFLQLLCQNGNVLGAYGWALQLYKQDKYYERAVNTLKNISIRFEGLIPYYENIWGELPSDILEQTTSLDSEDRFHTSPEENKVQQINTESSLRQFCIKSPNWYSVGQYIIAVYGHIKQTEQSMIFKMEFQDMVDTKCISALKEPVQEVTDFSREENSNNSNSNSYEAVPDSNSPEERCDAEANSQSSDNAFILPVSDASNSKTINQCQILDPNNGDSDSSAKLYSVETSKPKPRRRCSDLHFLEQWGWHKNRRYSSRKKPQQDRTEIDTTLNGTLRKIFSKFTNNSFEDEWPFNQEITLNSGADNDRSSERDYKEDCDHDTNVISLDAFQKETQEEFNEFIDNLKAKPFDLMLLMYKWLKFSSVFSNKRLPDEIQKIYLNIFNLYLNHFDFATWNQLSANNLDASYRICLLSLELEYANKFKENKSEMSQTWINTFNHLMLQSGCAYVALGEKYPDYKLRLINLEYLWFNSCNEFEKCVACLEHMSQLMSERDDETILHLPNLRTNCITKNFVRNTCIQLQRQIALNKIPKLFEAENWHELSSVIKNNILHSKNMEDSDNWVKDFKVQSELLLQSMWNLNEHEECLIWSEKFLHYESCQYLKEAKNSPSQKQRAESINFIFSYIEAIILNQGFDILTNLADKLARLVQNIIRILAYHLDAPFDKNNSVLDLDIKGPWVILHQITLREENSNPVVVKVKNLESENDDDLIPSPFLVLFTAHEFLGKHQWCTRDNGGLLLYILDAVALNLKAPLYDVCRDAIYEYIEQITFCLYGFPHRKARSRHLEDHEAVPVELTWSKAIQVFDLYRPDNLPEFNSYKLESISSDMEQFLLKITALIPQELNQTTGTLQITEYISGLSDIQLDMATCLKMPYKISSIFYLLGDYYFKSRDFSKAIKYYTLDLAGNTGRYDSWAGMALSKASKIETKLNGLLSINFSTFLMETEDSIRCFERCIQLNRNQTLLWIEFGSFTYTIHSYCSRHLKHSSEKLSMEQFSLVEERKEKMLNIAYNCFSLAATLQNATTEYTDDNGETHEEKWLCQYMLGKMAEKRKEPPKVYLNHYLMAANYLYDNNATYPIKINHSNPTTLSVEALEIFYRTNSAIIKYLEHEKHITREIGDLFNNILKNLANSPFAFNKAKIDGHCLNALKRKIGDTLDQPQVAKLLKPNDDDHATAATTSNNAVNPPNEKNLKLIKDNCKQSEDMKVSEDNALYKSSNSEPEIKIDKIFSKVSPSRRASQESAATGTTTTVTSSTTSSTSSSDSSTSSSDTDSDASSAENEFKNCDKDANYTITELEVLYNNILRNLEECVTRFPEHYKSIYRLVYHYLNGHSNSHNLNRCEQLLLGQYKTTLGNQINGLFFDRKNNNLFNGIWRIPSSEIDRPGSFAAHLVKCVGILIQLLMKSSNYKLLVDIGLQLVKTPDPDKRYIKDDERIELYQQSITYCAQIMRNILKKNIESREDMETLDLLIDIYKIHKKCVKHMNQKEPLFTQLLVDVYKFYVQDKIDCLPDNINILDLAIKLCLQEIAVRKNMEKSNNSLSSALAFGTSIPTANRPIPIPGLPLKPHNKAVNKISAHIQYTTAPAIDSQLQANTATPNFTTDMTSSANLLSMMSLFETSPLIQKDNIGFLFAEYYKQILERSRVDSDTNLTAAKNYPAASLSSLSIAPSIPWETTITLSNAQSIKAGDFLNTMQGPTIELEKKKTEIILPKNDLTITASDLKPFSGTELHGEHKQSAISGLHSSHTKPSSANNSGQTEKSSGNLPELELSHLSDLAQLVTVTSLPLKPNKPQSPNASKCGFTSNKFHAKPKSCVKNKMEYPAPYNRPTKTALSEESETLSALKTLNMANYSQHATLLNTYKDLLNSATLQNFEILAPKLRSNKRKPKPHITDIATVTPTVAPPGFISPQGPQVSTQSILSTTNNTKFSTYDSNITGINIVPKAVNRTSSPKSSFSSGTTPVSVFGQQHPSSVQLNVNANKTLQQKLAERQKANQLNEYKAPAKKQTSSDGKHTLDIIILD